MKKRIDLVNCYHSFEIRWILFAIYWNMINEEEIFTFVGILLSEKDTMLDFQACYKLTQNRKKRNQAVDDSFGKQ